MKNLISSILSFNIELKKKEYNISQNTYLMWNHLTVCGTDLTVSYALASVHKLVSYYHITIGMYTAENSQGFSWPNPEIRLKTTIMYQC